MRRFFLVTVLVAVVFPAMAFAQAKRPLDHASYDIWMSIEDETISDDGRWVLYTLVPQDGDAELRVHSQISNVTYSIPRGRSPQFTADGQFVVTIIKPELELSRQARRENKRSNEQPKDSLAILNLSNGDVFRTERVKSYKLADDAGGWVAYLLDETASRGDTTASREEPDSTEDEAADEPKKEKKAGTTLLVRELASGDETDIEHVTEYAFTKNGLRLAYAVSTKDGADDGVYVLDVEDANVVALATGEGEYKSPTFDNSGDQIAFLSNRDDYAAEVSAYSLFHWRAGFDEARVLVTEATPAVPGGWWVSDNGNISFSDNGARVFFGTAPRPDPEVEDSLLDEERVKLDIWHWQDPYIQPMQLLQANRERRRTYLSVVVLESGDVVQLATPEVPNVDVGQDGDAAIALGRSELPYRQLTSWDTPDYNDYYLVDVATGDRSLFHEKLHGTMDLSPNGTYAVWWDNQELAWYGRAVDGGQSTNLTASLTYPVHNEDHDWPYRPDAYGSAGWTEGDSEFLVYDRFDIWALDPMGRAAPRSITEGTGRRNNLRFRYVDLDRENEAIPSDQPLTLSVFNTVTKASGFYRDRVRGERAPESLVAMDFRFSSPTKAENANVVLYTRSSVEEFPNLWVSNLDFDNMRQVSDANPQQEEYVWATVELVDWRSTDGTPLQGLLYKPENFDPSLKYPLMVTFYERNSDNLFSHAAPIPHRSVVQPIFYASRGYLVFVPDIVYQVGYPGESAMDAVMPGVLQLAREDYVDEENIAAQGHSWGGYQIAYMVTKTNLFKAVGAGAIVSNMISAYGGIRWGTGMSRMFQYEKTQSRIGATLWEAPMRYIENSPIFWADKVETPILMMHNDHDAAVPWYQGIEMFVALRRLNKPVWMVNYNDEPHWPTTYANKRDWNIRMQQFFDHYLKGASAPVWLSEGIPAVLKGRTLGLEEAGRR
jgi:dipeptidyl aminopeptidase/acylaminoacyl peptidase